MSRKIACTVVATLFAAGTAHAATQGFAFTGEELGFSYPPLNVPLSSNFAAPVGTFLILTDGNISYSDDEPVGEVGCDPTTTRTMILDNTSFTSHMRMEFPGVAGGLTITFDKIQFGQEYVGPRYGAEWGVYSAVSNREETIAQFGPDGVFLVYGQPVDIGMGNVLTYDNLWANDCGNGIDHHLTVEAFHNHPLGQVFVTVCTHGLTGACYANLGPFDMLPQVRLEGIRGQFVRSPAGLGRTYADGMVCNGSAPVILPSGSETGTGTRGR